MPPARRGRGARRPRRRAGARWIPVGCPARHSCRAAWPSTAAGTRSPVASDDAPGIGDDAREQVRRADEVRDEPGRRSLVELLRRAELLHPAGVHHRDPVAHRERLLLVVGHVHERDPDLGLDPLELHLELAPELEVERAERLVEEQDVGPVGEGSGERDPLLLAARELVRAPLLVARRAGRARAPRRRGGASRPSAAPGASARTRCCRRP